MPGETLERFFLTLPTSHPAVVLAAEVAFKVIRQREVQATLVAQTTKGGKLRCWGGIGSEKEEERGGTHNSSVEEKEEEGSGEGRRREKCSELRSRRSGRAKLAVLLQATPEKIDLGEQVAHVLHLRLRFWLLSHCRDCMEEFTHHEMLCSEAFLK